MSTPADSAEQHVTSQDGWESGLVRGFECPRCGRISDGCFAVIRSADCIHLFCQRVAAERTTATGRYLHELTGDAARDFRADLQKLPTRPIFSQQCSRLRDQAMLFCRRGTAARAVLATQLGVSEESLWRLGVGFTHGFENYDRTGCYTAPERDAWGEIIGLHLRKPDGAKFQASGGRRGLFYDPASWHAGTAPILAVEGLSDTAAGLTLGLPHVIGRPSNLGGVDHLIGLLEAVPLDREIIVIGECDQKPDGRWPGREGAISTAHQLAETLERPIAWSLPPDHAKDTRAWLQQAPAGLPVERLAHLFLSGLTKTWVLPIPRVHVLAPVGAVRELSDWRDSMFSARQESLSRPGCYLDASPTGSGKTNVDLRVLLQASHPEAA